MSYGTTLALDQDGDLIISPMHRLTTISGTDKVVQDLTVILRSLRGSFPLNLQFGTDYPAMVDAGRNTRVIEHEIRRALSTYPYLQSIDTIDIAIQDLAVAVTVRATLTDGETVSLEATL